MKKRLLLVFILFLTAFPVISQELYIPRDVQKAFENGTRSKDGAPGENYWQNTAKYNIQLSVNPPNRTVNGEEEIVYTNNSPDTLHYLNIKLILNHHKPEAPRNRPVASDYLTSGIHIDEYKENGKVRKFTSGNSINRFVKLEEPLLPHTSINLSFKWHFDLSKQSGREGAIDSTTFYLAYFFPRVAVYDDYNGWDKTLLQGSLEFYNDFNDYLFEVTVPKNYVVWATGDLLNPKEVLQPKIAKRLSASMQSDDIIQIASQEELKNHRVTKQKSKNTWKWDAKHITDIAIAISNHYTWDASSVVVDSTTNRRVSTQAAYNPEAKDFEKMVQYVRHSLNWFSHHLPGVAYPYSKMTVIRGFADMEYPMMVNDNSTDSPTFTRFVVEHEIAHTYFPFYMGINETRFAFMDEGWATTLEYFIGVADLGKEKETEFYQKFRVKRWVNDPNMQNDLPIITPSNELRGRAYGINAYGKPSLGYLAVHDLLGDSLFKQTLKGYMARWNGKHPMPWDFFYSFNDLSGRNLNWFWKAWFFSNNYIDYALRKVQVKGNKATIQIENVGGMPAPFDVVVTMKNGKTLSIHKTAKVWENTDPKGKELTLEIAAPDAIQALKIDGKIWMDYTPENNTWEEK